MFAARAAPPGPLIRTRELLLWCLASLILAGLLLARNGPGLFNDSFQYLSEADNIRQGNGFSTSIVHFDLERVHRRIPAPLTIFPPGYALAITALSFTGVSLESAGLLWSLLCFAATVLLLGLMARQLGLSKTATRAALVVLLANSYALRAAYAVGSTSLFTALGMAALFCFFKAEPEPGEDAAPGMCALCWGHVLLGAACLVRYAGYFLLAGVVAFYAARFLITRRRRWLLALAPAAIPAGVAGLLMLRNTLLVGAWQGGNVKVSLPVWDLPLEFLRSGHHLLFGDLLPARLGPAEVMIGLAGAVLLWWALAAWRTGRYRWVWRPGFGLLALVGAVYLGALGYSRATTVPSMSPRYLYSLLPAMLLLAGALLTGLDAHLAGVRWRRRLRLAALVTAVAGYGVINARTTLAAKGRLTHIQVAPYFDAEVQPGQTLRAWVEASLSRGEVIFAANGQATAYLLRRKTVSLASRVASRQIWDEHTVRELMESYGARLLFLYPGHSADLAPEQSESPFLAGLLAGQPPPWLSLAARTPGVLVFRRR